MTDSTNHDRADDAADLRWIVVLGLAHPIQDGLRLRPRPAWSTAPPTRTWPRNQSSGSGGARLSRPSPRRARGGGRLGGARLALAGGETAHKRVRGVENGLAGIFGLEHSRVPRFLQDFAHEPIGAGERQLHHERVVAELVQ